MIYHIDTTGIVNLWKQLDSDYSEAHIDNVYHQLYVVPKSKGKLQVFDSRRGALRWNLSPGPQAFPNWFQGTRLIQNQLYVGDYNGGFNVYRQNGAITQSKDIQQHYMASDFLLDEKRSFIYAIPKNRELQNKILVYNIGLDLIRDNVFDFDLKGWSSKDDESVFVFYNDGNNIKIALFSYFYGNVNVLRMISGNSLNDVVAFSKTQFLLGTNDGVFYYDYYNNSLTQIISGKQISSMDKSEATNLVAISSENEVFVFSLSRGAIVQNYSLPYHVKKVLWQTNR